jgi:predicted RNase H-like HicB family nuclease
MDEQETVNASYACKHGQSHSGQGKTPDEAFNAAKTAADNCTGH